jgi:hypothetical protein
MLLKYMIFLIAIFNMVKTTTQSVIPCPESLGNGVCKNNGFCVILFNRDIQVKLLIKSSWMKIFEKPVISIVHMSSWIQWNFLWNINYNNNPTSYTATNNNNYITSLYIMSTRSRWLLKLWCLYNHYCNWNFYMWFVF